jgi:hypothetical protein
MEVLNNHVLVKPDEDFRFKGSFLVSDEFEPMQHVAVTGVVKGICNELYFRKLEKSKSEVASRNHQKAHARSVDYDIDIEVSEGDRVWYRYTVWTDPNNLYQDDLVFRYDQLYAKEVDGVLYPLNGWIFIKDNDDNTAEVVAVGSAVRSYLHSRDGNYPLPKVGQVIGYNKSFASKIEFPLWDTLGGVKRIQAKDILWLKR